MNIAQDFSPGTASGLNDLVPEARLSRCFTDQFACLSCWFDTVSWVPGGGVDEPPRRSQRRLSLPCLLKTFLEQRASVTQRPSPEKCRKSSGKSLRL